MKQATIVGIALAALAGPLWGHGTRQRPVTPTELTDEFIVHRLKLLGYSDVRVVRSNENSAHVTVQRGATRYNATVSRKLTGPGSLAVVNAKEVVEQLLRPAIEPPSPPPVIIR